MSNIKDILRESIPLIEDRMEKCIPRKYSKEQIRFMCGSSEDIDISAVEKSLSKPLWELASRGGKRWRAFLFLLIYRALDGKKSSSGNFDEFAFCAIPEIIHNGTLMIDDIEDLSIIRRSKPCIHLMEEYGLDIAINCGNTLYFLPMLYVMRSSIEKEKKLKIYEIYLQEMVNISIGQGIDIAWHKGNDGNITLEKYLKMCSFKTGTIPRISAKTAAVLAGADNETIEKIGKFVENFGVAFQIRNDLNDLIGREEEPGKITGSDIKEGKRSFMVIHVLTNKDAEEKDKKRLIEILDMHTEDKELTEEAINIIKKYDSIESARKYLEKIVRESWDEVESVFKDPESKKHIEEFKDYVIKS